MSSERIKSGYLRELTTPAGDPQYNEESDIIVVREDAPEKRVVATVNPGKVDSLDEKGIFPNIPDSLPFVGPWEEFVRENETNFPEYLERTVFDEQPEDISKIGSGTFNSVYKVELGEQELVAQTREYDTPYSITDFYNLYAGKKAAEKTEWDEELEVAEPWIATPELMIGDFVQHEDLHEEPTDYSMTERFEEEAYEQFKSYWQDEIDRITANFPEVGRGVVYVDLKKENYPPTEDGVAVIDPGMLETSNISKQSPPVRTFKGNLYRDKI